MRWLRIGFPSLGSVKRALAPSSLRCIFQRVLRVSEDTGLYVDGCVSFSLSDDNRHVKRRISPEQTPPSPQAAQSMILATDIAVSIIVQISSKRRIP
jgi:hypothetical protein